MANLPRRSQSPPSPYPANKVKARPRLETWQTNDPAASQSRESRASDIDTEVSTFKKTISSLLDKARRALDTDKPDQTKLAGIKLVFQEVNTTLDEAGTRARELTSRGVDVAVFQATIQSAEAEYRKLWRELRSDLRKLHPPLTEGDEEDQGSGEAPSSWLSRLGRAAGYIRYGWDDTLKAEERVETPMPTRSVPGTNRGARPSRSLDEGVALEPEIGTDFERNIPDGTRILSSDLGVDFTQVLRRIIEDHPETYGGNQGDDDIRSRVFAMQLVARIVEETRLHNRHFVITQKAIDDGLCLLPRQKPDQQAIVGVVNQKFLDLEALIRDGYLQADQG